MGLFDRNTARTKALEQFAREKGLRFDAKDHMGVRAYFGDMKLFRQGGHRHGRHVMERKTKMFEHNGVMDYYYTVSSGKSSKTYKQTVYFRVSEDMMLPAFHIFPEKWYHRIGKWFGMQDIDFIAYPDFSKYYLLQGVQPDFIEKFFADDKLIGHFMKYQACSVEAVGKYFVMYEPDILVSLRKMNSFIRLGDRLFSLLNERNSDMERLIDNAGDQEDVS